MPRKPLIDLRDAWNLVDRLAGMGAFDRKGKVSESRVRQVKKRIAKEARKRWEARQKRGAAKGGRGVLGRGQPPGSLSQDRSDQDGPDQNAGDASDPLDHTDPNVDLGLDHGQP